MKIRIPHLLTDAWDRLGDWTNVPIYARGKVEVRRIDVILLLGLVFCVGWHGWTTGWQGALGGGALYVLVVMLAVWLF